MEIFLISFIVLSLVMLVMAIGVIWGRPSIKGSCGGLNHLGEASACVCSAEKQSQCEKRREKLTPS
jgi:uncharacterized protein